MFLTFECVISIHTGYHVYGECFTNAIARDYRGVVSVTKTGKVCQRWTSQRPHSHANTPGDVPNAGLGAHNYCRNPNSEIEGAWCYTRHSSTRWEDCNIGVQQTECDGRFKSNFSIKPVAKLDIRCGRLVYDNSQINWL